MNEKALQEVLKELSLKTNPDIFSSSTDSRIDLVYSRLEKTRLLLSLAAKRSQKASIAEVHEELLGTYSQLLD